MRYEIPSFSHSESGDPAVNDEPLRRRVFVSLAEFFYPLYHVVSMKQPRVTDWADQKLREAHMNRSTETYLSGSLAVGTILGSLIGLLLVGLVYSGITTGAIALGPVQYSWFPEPIQQVIAILPDAVILVLSFLKVPVILLLTGLIGGAIGMCIAGAVALAIPSLRAQSRAKEIQMVFPDAVAMMYSLSEGGADQITIFQKMANAEDAFGELSVEFQRIVREAELFHEDYQTAIQKIREETPNEELERALSDMLGVLNSGGSFDDYLEQESERQREQRKREHEARIGVLETLGSTYTAVLMGPIMIVVMLVVMALIGSPMLYLLGAVVYIGEPFLNIAYAAVISIIKADQPGDGLLEVDGEVPNTKASRLSIGPAADYRNEGEVFSQIWRAEAKNRVETILKNPFEFFRDEPDYTLVLSIPLAFLAVGLLIASGKIAPSVQLFTVYPVRQTLGFFFVPFYIILIPYVVMYEWGERRRRAITQTLDKDLRKLANTNQAGQPFHESLRITARDKSSLLAAELGVVYKKLINTGIPINRGLVELNNKYARPRLARTIKIIEKAQDVSSDITSVLKTAATSAQIQRDLRDEQAKKMRMLVVVVEASFLVFLVILAGMKLQMIDTLTRLIGKDPSWPNFETVKPQLLALMFFHAALIQGVCSGMIAGYLQRSQPRAGLKFALLNGTLALVAWLIILAI
jgi:flagellar protein FlaJ